MKKNIRVFLFFTFVCLTNCGYGQGFLRTEKSIIVDGSGKEIILRSMGLGGWMVQEGYMLKIYKNGTQHEIKQRVADLIGPKETDRFYDEWLKNHVRKADIDSMAHWGFNAIRLPMHYNLYTLPIEQEPVKGQNTWLTKGFEMTDKLLSWCKANKMYLILDLHAAPGGQGRDANISDYDNTKPALWESDANKAKTIALWKKLATRYANEPWIGGYDLINEPNWSWEGKQPNGLQDSLNTDVWALQKDITNAIREVDKKHLIVVEGNGWGGNYNGFPGPWDNNLVLSFHKYWNPNTPGSIARYTKLRDKYQVPLWLGETGENADQWFTDCIRLVEKNHIGWSWWPLKKIDSFVCPFHVNAPQEYQKLVDYWNNGGEKPTKEVAMKVLFEVAENLKAEKCFFVKDYVDAMFRQVQDSTAIPYKNHNLPGKIAAVDYDLGQQNYAYSDADYQNTVRAGGMPGNRGGQYRNDGVDINTGEKLPLVSSDYYVSSTQDGEWLNYTVNVTKAGNYAVSVGTGPKKTTGTIQLIFDNQTASPVELNTEPDKAILAAVQPVYLATGRHHIKVLMVKGGTDLDYLEFRLP